MIKLRGNDGICNKLKDKRNIILELTNGCNMACEYCFESNADKKPIHFMKNEVIKKAIDLVINQKGEEYNITFFGGEPLLNVKGIKYAIEYGNERAKNIGSYIRYYIVTNGTLINEEIIELFNRNDVYVFFSYDGSLEFQDKYRRFKDGSSTFEKITNNIKLFCKSREKCLNKYNASIRMTITRDFIPKLSETYVYLRNTFPDLKIGFALVSADSGKDYAITKDDLDVLRNEYLKLAELYIDEIKNGSSHNRFFESIVRNITCGYKKNYFCNCGDKYIAIGTDGDIYPCEGFLGYDKFSNGNIMDEKEKLCCMFLENVEENVQCKECWARYLCGGSCYQECYMLHNDVNSKDEIMCETYKMALEVGVRIYHSLMSNNLIDNFKNIIKTQICQNAVPVLNSANMKWMRDINLIFISSKDRYSFIEPDEIIVKILELCDGKHRIKDIVQCISNEYEGDETTIYNDVNEILQQFFDFSALSYING